MTRVLLYKGWTVCHLLMVTLAPPFSSCGLTAVEAGVADLSRKDGENNKYLVSLKRLDVGRVYAENMRLDPE